MKKCGKCGVENVQEARFCAECGSPLGDVPANVQTAAMLNTKNCIICGKKIGAFGGKFQCKDGLICKECYGGAGLSGDNETAMKVQNMTLEQFHAFIAEKNKEKDRKELFSFTQVIGNWAKFNDETKEMMLTKHRTYGVFKPDDYEIFSYDQIVDYELLEDGASILKGGVGRAAVGGLLFGKTGAIVGGVTRKQKSVCNSMQIKLTVRNYFEPAFYINMITSEMKKDSREYEELYKCAQDILSKLQLLTSEAEEQAAQQSQNAVSENQIDPVEEIRRFKELMDEGILTEEEFMAKKKQILGI